MAENSSAGLISATSKKKKSVEPKLTFKEELSRQQDEELKQLFQKQHLYIDDLSDMLRETEKLEHFYSCLLSKLERRINILPNQKLRCCRHRSSYQYYCVDIETGIPKYLKQSSPLLRKLAQREYDRKLYNRISAQLSELSDLKNKLVSGSMTNVFNDLNDGIKSYITPLFINNEKYSEYWKNEKNEGLIFHPEALIHTSNRGELLRSKSEVLIANELDKMNLPYKYEKALNVDGYSFFPDFTVLNPKTGKIYYWEHFGLIDDSSYREDAIRKLASYENAGFLIGRNLIITYETLKSPLTNTKISNTIKRYILSS